jgi:hypothetical protein
VTSGCAGGDDYVKSPGNKGHDEGARLFTFESKGATSPWTGGVPHRSWPAGYALKWTAASYLSATKCMGSAYLPQRHWTPARTTASVWRQSGRRSAKVGPEVENRLPFGDVAFYKGALLDLFRKYPPSLSLIAVTIHEAGGGAHTVYYAWADSRSAAEIAEFISRNIWNRTHLAPGRRLMA